MTRSLSARVFPVQSAAMNDTRGEEVHAVTVSPDQDRERLDRLLSGAVTTLSRSRIKALILDGRARIAGRTVTEPSARVNSGDAVTLSVPAAIDDTPAHRR